VRSKDFHSSHDIPRLEAVRNHPDVVEFLRKGDEVLGALGYTEHGTRHASLVAHIAYNVLERLDYPAEVAELAAMVAYHVLRELQFTPAEYATIMSAIGNHDEEMGRVLDPVSAALILGDKSDVHRSRVRDPRTTASDIHDRVNYSAERSFLNVDPVARRITLELTIDTAVSGVIEYFEIFLSRMIMCRRAAEVLGCTFQMEINGQKLF
jgi:metal-dependent HD superfamily phosphatase/phosphodiesterase